jgi:hypothetical protein
VLEFVRFRHHFFELTRPTNRYLIVFHSKVDIYKPIIPI